MGKRSKPAEVAASDHDERKAERKAERRAERIEGTGEMTTNSMENGVPLEGPPYTFEPDRWYWVRFSRITRIGALVFRPNSTYQIIGVKLATVSDQSCFYRIVPV